MNVSDGGVPKRPVERVRVSREGTAGDRQRDRRRHGGEERALCLYSADLIDALHAEGHPVRTGATGENLTIRGVPWDVVQVGARVRAGALEAEVTGFAHPCENLRPYFVDEDFTRISQKVRPGWSRVYARVLVGGEVARGDAVVIRVSAPAMVREDAER